MKPANQKRVSTGVPTAGRFDFKNQSESPDVVLETPGKRTSKGVVTTVQLPDGTVAQRTSKSGNYTHAVVMSAEVPEMVIAAREESIRTATMDRKNLQDALENPSMKRKLRYAWETDPDVSATGTPSYNGFEAMLYAPNRAEVASVRCNSKNMTKGRYYPDTGKYNGDEVFRVTDGLKESARRKITHLDELITKDEADLAAVKDGSYDLGSPGVSRWSSREDLAEKAARTEFSNTMRTRRATVVPVDQ